MAAVILLSSWASPAAAQPPDAATLLAMAPSPGVEALLLPHAGVPRVPQRWRDLLTHDDVRMRAVAARLLGVARVRSALGGVRTALTREADPLVLAELLRTLAIIGSEAADPLIYARLGDVSPAARRQVLRVMASLRPESVAAHLAPGRGLAGDAEWAAIAFERLAERWPAHATRVELIAMATADATLRDGVRRGARRAGRDVPDELAGDEPSPTAPQFLPVVHDASSNAPAGRGRRALAGPSVSMLADVPAALLLDLVRLTGCVPTSGDERVLQVHYGDDGRAVRANVGADPWSPRCAAVAQALYSVAYGDPAASETDDAIVVVRLDRAYATCLAEAQAAPPRSNDTVDRPAARPPLRKVHDRAPTLPERARREGISGDVLLAVSLAPSGCVADARVVRGWPWLDAAAVQAVSHWRYARPSAGEPPLPAAFSVVVPFRQLR